MDTEKIKSNFQLLATTLLKLDFKNDFVIINDSIKVKKGIDVSYDVNDITNEDNQLLGIITLNISAVINSEENEMDMELKLQGCFISDECEDIEAFKKMLEINGCASLYSIARSIILSITSQACVGAHILLPMINVFKLSESHKEEENS